MLPVVSVIVCSPLWFIGSTAGSGVAPQPAVSKNPSHGTPTYGAAEAAQRWVRPSLQPGLQPGVPSGRPLPQKAQGKEAPSLDELRRDLRSRYGDKRRRSVVKLGRRGGEEALKLVIAALSDKDAQVADEAELQLPGFEPDGALGWLLGKEGLRAKDPWVRIRAAGAVGRMPVEVPLKPLAKALDRRSPEFTRVLLWSIESLARRGVLSGTQGRTALAPLAKLIAKGAPDPVRAAALAAMVQLRPEEGLALVPKARGYGGTETLCAALSAEFFAERAAETAAKSATGADKAGSEGRIRELLGALEHEDPLLRAHGARLVGEGYGGRPALARLALRLGVEPRPAVALTVAAALGNATGLKHGRHQKSWVRAIADLPGDWTPVTRDPAGDAKSKDKPAGLSVAALGRLDPLSDRVAILVDFSGSLWNERKDGTKRKDALDPEVKALLGRLGGDSQFLLVPYTHKCHPFDEDPVDATRRNIRRAQEFFDRARMRGKGNVWDAIQLSLAHKAIDRILIVTDGAPTGGHRWNVDLMVQLLLEQTRFRPVIFDLVLFDAPGGLTRRWEPLASRTGGRLVVIDR